METREQKGCPKHQADPLNTPLRLVRGGKSVVGQGKKRGDQAKAYWLTPLSLVIQKAEAGGWHGVRHLELQSKFKASLSNLVRHYLK